MMSSLAAGPTTLFKLSLPAPFNGDETTVSFIAGEGNTYKGQFETSLQLSGQAVPVSVSATMIKLADVTTLQLSGSTGPFIVPNTGFNFAKFSMNGSVTLGSSTTINYLNLDGGATLAGIGKANGVFTYKDSALAFSLKLAPDFPPPFQKVRAASMT